MTFQQLKYIDEIARCGSINKAAQNLFVSQSSVSSSIKELEKEFSIAIFRRSNRGIELTPEGKEFLSYARPLLEQKQHIESIYASSNVEPSVRLSISTQRYPFAVDAFISLLQKVKRPRFEFRIKETGMYKVIDDVFTHSSDVGVIFVSNITEKIIHRVLLSKNIEFHELKRIKPHVFVRREHPLAKKSTLTAEDLSPYVYMAFEHDQGVSLDFAEEVRLMSLEKPTKVIQVNDRATATNIITNTDAYTTGSGLLVEGLVDERMRSVPIEGNHDEMKLGWIKLRGKRLPEEAVAFIEELELSISKAVDYTAGVFEHQRRVEYEKEDG